MLNTLASSHLRLLKVLWEGLRTSRFARLKPRVAFATRRGLEVALEGAQLRYTRDRRPY